MPSLSFEGETHAEIVGKVRRWLASLDGPEDALSAVAAVERASELTKDALTVIAQAAPGPIRQSEVMKALTRMGYEATDRNKKSLIAGLDALTDAEGGVLKRVDNARRAAAYEMSSAIAKQVLRSLRG
ncbi:MAG TPA: hypothetical protein VFB78_07960 [Acidimicrobiales bacterium]|nr:hypothetical protein [Acidimicrobiales bacterium]